MKHFSNRQRLLASALLLSLAAVSCGENAVTPADTGTPKDTAAAVTEAVTESGPMLEFEREDNGGAVFHLLATTSNGYEYLAESQTGDVVNDAVYNRNLKVEEYLGIKLDLIGEAGGWDDRDTFNGLIRNSVIAGDGAYDLVSAVTVCTIPLAGEGVFLDLSKVDTLNFDNPWWVAGLGRDLTIAGKQFGFMGDASLSLYKDLAVIFFNRNLLNNYDLESPYTMVREGRWTLDAMNTMIKGVENDINGDGKLDINDDLMGLLMNDVPNRAFMTAFELSLIRYENGVPTFPELSERTYNVYDKLYRFYTENANIQVNPQGADYAFSASLFAADHALLMNTLLRSSEYLRDMKSDFGIVPFPKADEEQENYHTQIGTSTSMFFIPNTTADPALTGKVCEALSYFSYADVVAKYYEVALKEKYSRDDEVQQMLDIIRASATMDFAFAYSTVFTDWPNLFTSYNHINEKVHADLASYHTKRLTKWRKELDKLTEAYEKLD